MPIQSGTGSTNQTMTVSAFKKLVGKSNTSNRKAFYEESIASSVQLNTKRLFGEALPQNVPIPTDVLNGTGSLYTTFSASAGASPVVQIVEFDVIGFSQTYDADENKTFGNVEYFGGDEAQVTGEHSYYLKLRSDYNDSSSFGGTAPFSSSQVLYSATGTLQLVHPQFGPSVSNGYFLELYKSKGGDRIDDTDATDWVVDYYNGTILVQDYDASKVPTYAVAYIYIGKYADEKISDASGSGGGITYSRRALTAHATSSATDTLIGISSSGNSDNIELRLIAANSLSNGQYLTVKKEDGYSSVITISCSAGDKIDGQDSIRIESPFGAVNLYSDATASYFIY